MFFLEWEQYVIIVNGPTTHLYSSWTDLNQNDDRWHINTIDTTPKNIDLVVDEVVLWIKSMQNTLPTLSNETRWWES